MDDTDTIIDVLVALRQVSTADPSQLHAWVDTLTKGYKSVGEDASIRQVWMLVRPASSFSNFLLHPLRRNAFTTQSRAASGLADAWQAYAEQMESQALELTEDFLAVGVALARLTRNCLAGCHEAKTLVG